MTRCDKCKNYAKLQNPWTAEHGNKIHGFCMKDYKNGI